MNELIVQSGIDRNIIIMVMILPIIATMIGFVRHILGFRTLGIYLSLILTFIFVQIGFENNNGNVLNALKYGIPLVGLVFFVSLLCYLPFKKLALHYYPKLALVITGVSVIMILVIILSGIFNFGGFIKLNAFTLVLIAGISEKFFIILARKNLKTTLFISIESIIIATICYLFVSWYEFQNLLINYPYVILLLFPINYLIGRFTGLRVTEYLRFWDILVDKD